MNRLQKKCVLATAGVHLLLLVILLVGPAFFRPRSQVDNMPVLDVIPANLVDAAVNSGIRSAQPPPVSQPAPQPPAPQPQPVVMPRAPTPSPEKIVKPEAVKLQPAQEQRHKIEPNLKPVVRGESSKVRDESQRARALRNAVQNLKRNFSPGTTIDMPGNSSVAYASYADVVKSVYDQAWAQIPLGTVANSNENVRVSVVIASDGTVVSARIIESSGDTALDASVQKTLERVTFIAPFPEGTTDKQRPYTISFNPQLRQMLE